MKIVTVNAKGILIFPYLGPDHDLSDDLASMPDDERSLFFEFNINQLARLLIETIQSEQSDLNTVAVVANRYAQLSASPQQYAAESEYMVLEVNLEPDVCKWSMIIPPGTVATDEEALSFIKAQYISRYN